MKREFVSGRLYVKPHVDVFCLDAERLLSQSMMTSGGHEDALDENFERVTTVSGGHEDALDESFERVSHGVGGHLDDNDEHW